MTSYSPSFDELRGRFDRLLGRTLDARRQELPDAEPLLTELRRLIDAGGKRLRPLFCYWAYRGCGGSGVGIDKVASSLELLHLFALIHDDIMDGGVKRRGVDTINARHGDDVALLAGDLALVLADSLFMDARFEPGELVRAFAVYSRMRREVIAGQYLDLKLTERPTVSENDARRVANLKSGSYSVTEPLLVGASLAGATEDVVGGLERFGTAVGVAFQLRDDLLGTFGDIAHTGKSTDSDIRDGKRNLVFATTLELISEPEREDFLGRWGGGDALTDPDVVEVRRIIEGSGARDRLERQLDDLVASAEKELDALQVAPEPRSALHELAEMATRRTS